jgi:acyl-CoA thioester hydrolase
MQVFVGSLSRGGRRTALITPDEEDGLNEWHEALLRVRYAETDKMGVVYHANYLIWFEIGRTEFCRARGFSYRDMEENEDAFLVVVESYCRYKAPAYYDDVLMVRTHITELRRRSLRFGYEIVRESDGTVIAEGETGHVVTDANGRVRSMPPGFAEMLLASPIGSDLEGETAPGGEAPL